MLDAEVWDDDTGAVDGHWDSIERKQLQRARWIRKFRVKLAELLDNPNGEVVINYYTPIDKDVRERMVTEAAARKVQW